eukprot:70515-Rhodomonas_salina.2
MARTCHDVCSLDATIHAPLSHTSRNSFTDSSERESRRMRTGTPHLHGVNLVPFNVRPLTSGSVLGGRAIQWSLFAIGLILAGHVCARAIFVSMADPSTASKTTHQTDPQADELDHIGMFVGINKEEGGLGKT